MTGFAQLVIAVSLLVLAPRCFVGLSPQARLPRPAQRATMPEFDMNSVVDRTEMQLCNTTLKLTSSVFGFPDYESLVTLNDDGTILFFGGMVAKELGAWCVIEGDPNEGEDPNDLFIEFTQPLTDLYKEAFTVPGGTAFWRGRLSFRTTKAKKQKVFVEGGIVVSEREEGTSLVREGIFSAESATKKMVEDTRQKAQAAFQRALSTPKAESTGFKTPARIAGAGGSRKGKALPGGQPRGTLSASQEDLDMLEDGKGKS
eukprot:s3351_g4.t1